MRSRGVTQYSDRKVKFYIGMFEWKGLTSDAWMEREKLGLRKKTDNWETSLDIYNI